MHELAICQALLAQVEPIAREHAARIERIRLSVGPLSGVDAGQLARAFELARQGSAAAEAELAISTAPVRVRCRDCDAESPATPNRLLCARCGSWRTRLASGDELLLLGIDLTDARVEADAA
jgi:hydrogenase nickel incorporation protein HypA/HybF